MTTEATPALPTVPAPALFSLDLGANGGVLAPTSAQELFSWVQQERQYWGWLDNIPNNGGQRGAIEQGRSQILEAASSAQQAVQQELSSPGNFQTTVVRVYQYLESALKNLQWPHSSTPVAKRVEIIRQRDTAEAIAYLFAYIPANGHPFDGREVSSWRGLIEGITDRFGLAENLEELQQATIKSTNELLAKAGRMLGEKSAAYDELHRRYEALAAQVAATEKQQSSAFADFIAANKQAHDDVVQAHEKEMATLQKTFREGMTLRAPVEYWESRQNRHERRTWVTGAISFISMAALAISLGFIAHWVLSNLTADGKPDAWRVAVIGLVGVLGVWAVRLIVRIFLSNAHLGTDAAERVTMVKTYLALLEADKLPSDDDKKLILQALFRPASDGIVKDESLPHPALDFLTKLGGK